MATNNNNKPISQCHTLFLTMFVFLSMIVSYISAPSPSDDVNTLLRFKQSLQDDSNALASWNPAIPPCLGKMNNWAGVVCSRGGSVWGLKLENMGLSGAINVDALSELRRLRSVNFMNNRFTGPMPDFRRLKTLKSIFLSNNQFEGPIDPNAFEGLRRLKKVHLANNKLSGEIPTSLIGLKRLVELRLEGNQFQGSIPNLESTMIQSFNVSNNQLQGPVPENLAKFDPTAFAGNLEMCGGTLSPCPSASSQVPILSSPTPPPPTSDKPIPIIAIVAGVVIAMILSVLIILMVLRKRYEKQDSDHRRSSPVPAPIRPKKSTVTPTKNNKENYQDDEGSHRSLASTSSKHNKGGGENGKLTFLREDRLRFDLTDLLKASAEILGSGCFGSSYKAAFNNGSAVVVKRYRKMNNVGREEFQEQMRRLGRLSHPNLLPLVAYYYRKEEKLFMTDPVQKGSLAHHLHGQKGKSILDWPTRLKVIKGMAKGLLCLYNELPCLVAPHGHLKSSNVLLSGSFEPILGDYGLIPLINQDCAQSLMIAYKSPEYFNNGRITKKTDVWALGILIIEVLTGKFPSPYLQEGSEVDMGKWVESVVGEGFDKNMGQHKNSDVEMQKLLNIGLACCESDVEKRFDIKEACEKIEEVKEKDNDDDYSAYASTEADMRSSRGISDDFTVTIN